MKRVVLLICALLAFLLCACEATPAPVPTVSAPPDTPAVPSAVPGTTPNPSAAPSAAPAPETAEPTVEPVYWQDMYSAFLEDNYTAINEIFYGPPLGLGFIDLDIDGVPEMILFDGGASASLGVNLFDIIDGQVTCVSAALTSVSEHFAGDYFQDLFVNANYFEDFRLMRNQETGQYFFCVDSGNGAIDFYFRELILFQNAGEAEAGGKDGQLSLYSYLYKYEETDVDTNESTLIRCSVDGKAVEPEEYTATLEHFQQTALDTDYEAKGIFFWTANSYSADIDGYSRLISDALDAYVPLPDDVYHR